MMIEIKNLDQLNEIEMTEAKYKLLVIRVREIICKMISSPDVEADVKLVLRNRVFLDDLPKKAKQEALKDQSTASYPNPKCRLIMIGVYGSVWIDCFLQGKATRIAIDPASGRYELEEISCTAQCKGINYC